MKLKNKDIAVDSFLDIAVNKFNAVNRRQTEKDFVDLYFLLRKFSIWDLMQGAKVKFNMETDPWIFGSDLVYAAEKIQTLPKMKKPLSQSALKSYFKNLGLKLGRKATQ